MGSNGNGRRSLLTAGGVLSVAAGIFQINNGAVLVAYFLRYGAMPRWGVLPFLPGRVIDWWEYAVPAVVGWRPSIVLLIIGLSLLILGILATAGGISAIRTRNFGLSLAGAICALQSGLLGILAVIFVGVVRGEFRAEG